MDRDGQARSSLARSIDPMDRADTMYTCTPRCSKLASYNIATLNPRRSPLQQVVPPNRVHFIYKKSFPVPNASSTAPPLPSPPIPPPSHTPPPHPLRPQSATKAHIRRHQRGRPVQRRGPRHDLPILAQGQSGIARPDDDAGVEGGVELGRAGRVRGGEVEDEGALG